jgi:hypothetical protein
MTTAVATISRNAARRAGPRRCRCQCTYEKLRQRAARKGRSFTKEIATQLGHPAMEPTGNCEQ